MTHPPKAWHLLRAMRPKQWTKNAFVFAALIFALGDQHQQVCAGSILLTIMAAAAFCLLSSSIYLFNDLRDLEKDRNHPTKKFRPLAAGEISIAEGKNLGAVLLVVSLGIAGAASLQVLGICLIYLLMQAAYTLKLKNIAYLDVLIISTGFVLRALCGAAAAQVMISPWLLACTFTLALYLGLCKRRHEKVVLGDLEDSTRSSMRHYTAEMLDKAILLVSGATIAVYSIYTVSPGTVDKFGGRGLALTIPFTAFGLYRYYILVYRREEGGHPEKVLLTDLPLIANLAAYGAVLLGLFLV